MIKYKNKRIAKRNIFREFALRFYFSMLLLTCSILAKSQEIANAVDYSHKRGFYTDSIQLELSTKTKGGNIRYTLDGSKPTLTNGFDYTNPISIKSNAMVRAYAYAPNFEDSKIKTHSYIFPEQVIRQTNKMVEDYGYDYSSKETGKVFWTEEMDPEIVDAPEYKDEMIQALLDIPTLSIVMPKDDLWGEHGIHWGDNLQNKSDDFERECSVEMIYPKGYKNDSFKSWQENTGIRIQGAGGRSNKGTFDHKQSFSLVFKKKYGIGKLKHEIFADAPHGQQSTVGKYDRIILRAGHDNGWGIKFDREKTVYTRDQLCRDLQILMTGFGSHGTFVHLYLNGKYWGLYNPCERPDNNFLANHLGGNAENYFFAKGKDYYASEDRNNEPGQSRFRFHFASSKNYSTMPFSEMQNWVMVDKSIASFLIYGYANTDDIPQHYYGNSNEPDGPVVWIPWDLEDAFDVSKGKHTSSPDVNSMLKTGYDCRNAFESFWTNIDFQMRFNDLVYKHFFNDGILTDENVIITWDNLTNYINKAIICESARWGDERSSNPMDRDHEWNTARLAVRNDFKGRSDIFISQLQEKGYFSTVSAPIFLHNNKEIFTSELKVKRKDYVKISFGNDKGVVYYTTDGSDPRTWDLNASVSENAIQTNGTNTIIEIKKTTTIKARTLNGEEWSPLHEIIVVPDKTLFAKLFSWI